MFASEREHIVSYEDPSIQETSYLPTYRVCDLSIYHALFSSFSHHFSILFPLLSLPACLPVFRARKRGGSYVRVRGLWLNPSRFINGKQLSRLSSYSKVNVR